MDMILEINKHGEILCYDFYLDIVILVESSYYNHTFISKVNPILVKLWRLEDQIKDKK